MVKLALSFLLIASAARADSTTQECLYANRLYQRFQSKASNLRITRLDTEDAGCILSWTPKPGESILFSDRKKNKDDAKSLALKWKDGTITDSEKDKLLKMMVLLLLDVD